MDWAPTNWTCPDCGTLYDHDLTWYCCSGWYDRSVDADPYEE